jgi:hypothetical protein
MKDGHHRIVVYHHAQMIALETVNVSIKYAIVIMVKKYLHILGFVGFDCSGKTCDKQCINGGCINQ